MGKAKEYGVCKERVGNMTRTNTRHYKSTTRFTPGVLERMETMRYHERRSCRYIADHFGTTERQVQKLLCNSGHVWDCRGLRVPIVTTWDFRGMDL
jgi:hypothetical protein